MSKLYSPGKIGQLEMKNRLVMTTMHLGYCPGGEVSDRILEFYRLRAQGGVGLIILGAIGIDPLRVNTHDMIQMYEERFIPGLRRLTDAIHGEGTKIFGQLFHPGRYARSKEYSGLEAVAPSAVFSRFTGETPHELTQEEIEEIIFFFAEAAKRAQKAGFDGVEIVGNSGYLIGQFLSPVTNQRTDKYGGNLEQRMIFSLEVIAAVRKAVGSDYPIMFRVGGNDFIEGGNSNVEAKALCVAIQQAGVDAINVTGGWHETHVPQLTMDVPPGVFSYLGKEIKSVVSIPVLTCNRMDVQIAEKIVDDGNSDFIGMARGYVADPYLANKAKNREYATIRPCIACNQGCVDNIFFGKKLNCLVNAEAGVEVDLMQQSLLPVQIKVANPEKILVVGAGVAGLEFARVATLRGHHVTIWEATLEPGGQIAVASAAPGRHAFRHFVNYLIQACYDINVKIYYGKKASGDNILEAINAGIFQQVVIATGAKQIAPLFPIDEEAVVVQAWDVLKKQVKTGSRVVIIGGGAVGVETALLLAEIGTLDAQTLRFLMLHRAENAEELYRLLNKGNKQITVIGMDKGIGKDIGPSTRWSMLAMLKQSHVKTMDQSKVLAVTPEGVLIETTAGQELILADTVIFALGSRSDAELYVELQGKIDKLSLIGDARKTAKMQIAIRGAYEEAML